MIFQTVKVLLIVALIQGPEQGLIKFPSDYSFDELVERSSKRLVKERFKVFNIINHNLEGGNSATMLRPTATIVFGSPTAGTKLLSCDQMMGFELPLKILIWQDQDGKNWIGFKDPMRYLDEYKLQDCRQTLDKTKLILTDLCLTISE